MNDIMSNDTALRFYKGLGKAGMESMNLRRFLPVQGYISPNTVAATYASHVVMGMEDADNVVTKDVSFGNIFSMGCWQSIFRWPMYAVTRELMEAMFMTDPPGDITWSELQWPIKAATFLLPDTEQVRRELKTSRPLAITVGRLVKPPKDTPVQLGQLLGKIAMPAGSYERDMVTLLYHDDRTKLPMLHNITAMPEWTLEKSFSREVHREQEGIDWVDDNFIRMERATKLAVNFLAFMTSRYEVETEQVSKPLRKAHTTKKHTRDELHGVRWLGQGYKRKGPPQGGHHASPNTHWRRGHFRHARVGPGRTVIKVVWIEPMLVG